MPRVEFLIGGVQKGGTTALAHYLAQHPGIRLPSSKEAHVFDAPEFDEAWTATEIDARYAPHFPAGDVCALHGDATPIYIAHPMLIARIARYNPEMRWILLLRDPVDRAISQYHMERARGLESWPMLPAFLLERLRLAGHLDDLSDRSPLRTHGYLWRGDYARQLDALYACFPRRQVLPIRSDHLRADPLGTLDAVYGFLGVPAPATPPAVPRVFEGRYPPAPWWTRAAARVLLAPAMRRLERRHGIAFRPQPSSADARSA